jgi:hypothetical protein
MAEQRVQNWRHLTIPAGAMMTSMAAWAAYNYMKPPSQSTIQSTQARLPEEEPKESTLVSAPFFLNGTPQSAFPLEKLDPEKVPLSAKELLRLTKTLPRSMTEEKLSLHLQQTLQDLQNALTSFERYWICLARLFRHCQDAIKLKTSKDPYDGQLLASMELFVAPGTGAVGQVKTGEGKSLIVNLTCAVYALLGYRVHVMSSNEILASRDYTDACATLAFVGVSSACIVRKQDGRQLSNSVYQQQVLFGSVNCYQFRYLDEGLATRRGEFDPPLANEIAILDEADNLMLDRYHSLPTIGRKFTVPMASADQLKAIYDIGHQVSHVEEVMFSRIKYRVDFQNMPDERIRTFCRACIEAVKNKVSEIDYVVKTSPKTLQRQVVIVDYAITGEFQWASRWSFGVHEFVELKEGIIPATMNTNVAQSVHHCFFQRYNRIIGLTGTLGSDNEKQELRRTYNISLFEIPPRVPSQYKSLDFTSFRGENNHYSNICAKAQSIASRKRPVLIIVDTIMRARMLYSYIKSSSPVATLLQVLTGEMEVEPIIKQAGCSKQITIATLIAGRGVDIKPDLTSLKAGGLHVIVTFLPQSIRVERQLFGRAARQGNPGSGELMYERMYDIDAASYHSILLQQRDSLIQTTISSRRQHQYRGEEFHSYQERWFKAAKIHLDKSTTNEYSDFIFEMQEEWATLMLDLGLSILEDVGVVVKPPLPLDADARIDRFLNSVRVWTQ